MSNTWKCGDRARSAIDGPVMIVTGVSPDSNGRQTVWCSWFDDRHVHNTAGYDAADLEAVEIADLGPPP